MELGFEEIKKLIPQRFPFIMIDRIIEMVPGKEVVSIKNVSGNDILFLGHFPEKAIMPGAAIIEAMAQTSIVLFASDRTTSREEHAPIYYFGSVKARFHHPVVPGDQLRIKVVNVKTLPTGAYVSGEAFVGDKKVSEADLVFSVKDE
ncbi:MAG TPA: 3-hydroxyacyl-ACP dehydratase FabZ [Thermodesulfovibrionales bacterium]|nr:3-hydroxyacyl-ACP dehydratase FabZ [Thermodesulfovibrionales bacterium]